uniref:Apple domain-containing protein n=1 Tax=Panagrellus redivivus TaxID=6233 RepID=A0A7E4V3C9_PANRE
MIFIVSLFRNCNCTDYAHLCGYTLTGDILASCKTQDDMDCAELCDVTASCLGFQFVVDTGECNLFNAIRRATVNNSECSFYIKTTSKQIVVPGRNGVGPVNTLLQNLLYASDGPCPDGWTVESTRCTLNISEETCYEFGSFLNATFANETNQCVIPLTTFGYMCLNLSWKYGSFADGDYCHIIIPKFTGGSGLSYVERCKEYCASQTRGVFTTIHSADEDKLVNGLQNATNLKGIAIGLIAPSGVVQGITSLSWYDGSAFNYNGFNNTIPETGTFNLTIIMDDGLWHTSNSSFPDNFNYIACKTNATQVKLLTD